MGDTVEEDETIAQIETDKVTIDVRAPQAGVITTILVRDPEPLTLASFGFTNYDSILCQKLKKLYIEELHS